METMAMCFNAYTAKKVTAKSTTYNLIIRFTGQLKQWWFNYLLKEERDDIAKAKTDKGEDDSFATLIHSIIKHFIGVPTNIINRQSYILMNLNCPKLLDFR